MREGQGASGGCGILIWSDLDKPVWSYKGGEFIAHAVQWEGKILVVVAVYVANSPGIDNRPLYEELSKVLSERCQGDEVLVCAGDYNAYLPQLDGKENDRGKLMVEFVQQYNLTIGNLTTFCEGKYTRIQGNQRSCLDYVLLNSSAMKLFKGMHIDEQKKIVDCSDHTLITCKLESKSRPVKTKKVTIKIVRHKAAAQVVERELKEDLEAGNQISLNTLKTTLKRNITRQTKIIKINPNHRATSQEIKRLTKTRKLIGREWDRTRRAGENTAEIEAKYRQAQSDVRKQVDIEESARNRKMYDYILKAPRNTRAKRMWNYIRKHNGHTRGQHIVKDSQKRQIPESEVNKHLNEVGRKLLGATETVVSQDVFRVEEPVGIRVTMNDVSRVISSMSTKGASGPDGIPPNILKELSDIGHYYIAEAFNAILNGEDEIPKDWREGRVTLLEKPNSEKGILTGYRPLTISDVLYRVFTKILASNIKDWVEENRILGEMQNGFRKNRRGEDNVFILTTAVEAARFQNKGLICTFLDASRAYDGVNRDKLWTTLTRLGMDRGWINLLKLLYMDNGFTVKYGEHSSDRMATKEGLRQGCPISPLAFALYISDLEERLIETNIGFEVRIKGNFFKVREKKVVKIPGLLFADDLVLMTHKWCEMEQLLQVVSDFGEEKDIKFNPTKSAVVVFAIPRNETARQLNISGLPLPEAKSYKYLGIEMMADENYLLAHEKALQEKAKVSLQQLRAKSLWKFNRFEVSKVMWKATAVPKLTYCNAAIVINPQLENKLETSQRSAGRWALGVPWSSMANEFIDGELGWSPFNAREAQSKITFFERIRVMEEHRWPKLILTMTKLIGYTTKAERQEIKLRQLFGCKDLRIERYENGTPKYSTFSHNVKENITKVLNEKWERGMREKTSLEEYRTHKKDRGVIEHLYDNSRGSQLFVEARAGVLWTKHRQHRVGQAADPTCRKCNQAPETIRHVILGCDERENHPEEFRRRLGLTEEKDYNLIADTKRRLVIWERETRQGPVV